MAILQVKFYVPEDINTKVLTGDYRIDGGVVRHAIGPNKGQIVKHLDVANSKEDQQTESLVMRAVQFISNNKKTVISCTLIAGAAAAATYIVYKFKKREPKEITHFRAQLKTYINEIRNGALQLATINSLLYAINDLKNNKSFSKIKIELSAEELDVLVNKIHTYTLQLAEQNNYSICKDELQESNDSIENLRNCLTIQKNVFEFAA